MSAHQVASRYAQSLLDLAIDQGKTEAVREDMLTFKEALKSRELYLLLKSPIVDAGKKAKCLVAIFEGKLDTLTMSFILLVVRKGREELLPEMVDEFTGIYNKRHHIAVVSVTTAANLDQATLHEITNKINNLTGGNKTIQMETKVDPSLIGGFIIRYEDKLYDSSVQYQLSKLKQTFSHN